MDEMITSIGSHAAELLLNRRWRPGARLEPGIQPFTAAQSQAALDRISQWPDYAVTPLVALDSAADRLGIAALYCKDESERLGLASFKALGAVYASVVTVSEVLARRLGRKPADDDLLTGRHAAAVSGITLACATDGNHGFSVAHAARLMGCGARIYLPRGVSAGREAALRATGAEVICIDGIYEEASETAHAAAAADAETYIVSDYATPEYMDVPRLCMAGYSVMFHEIGQQVEGPPPTHIFAPAGCGGLAAATLASTQMIWPEAPPRVIVVEPVNADCVWASAQSGKSVRIDGDLETIMGGLSCAAVSHVAWPILDVGASAFIRMADSAAIEAMRLLARPGGSDPQVVVGETGAAGLGALLALSASGEARKLIGLDASSRVLVMACEGATDPDIYAEIVGRSD